MPRFRRLDPSFTGMVDEGRALRSETPRRGGDAAATTRSEDDATTTRAGRLRCRACGHPITDESERIEVGGAHVHVRTNPHGYRFEFGCFASAPGCVPDGVPSMQATWFPGFFWWLRLCGRCGTHLGWLFFPREGPSSGLGSFVALVLDRLTSRA